MQHRTKNKLQRRRSTNKRKHVTSHCHSTTWICVWSHPRHSHVFQVLQKSIHGFWGHSLTGSRILAIPITLAFTTACSTITSGNICSKQAGQTSADGKIDRFNKKKLTTKTTKCDSQYKRDAITACTQQGKGQCCHCKGVLLIVIRCNEVTNFLIPSAGN